MSGTITGELRSLMQRYDNFADVEMVMLEGTDFDRLCDAIDAVHANLERENESLRRELDRVLGEQDEDTTIGGVTVTVTPALDWTGVARELRAIADTLAGDAS